jgi:hypothetical protein
MKKISLYPFNTILLILLFMPNSCMYPQSDRQVKGNGMTVDKSYKVSEFHGIDVSCGFDVVLVQGNSEGLTVTAQENVFDYVKVNVEQGILKIYTEKNIMSQKSMKARISFKNIDNLKVSGGGDITCETSLNVPVLDMHIGGGGDLNAEINTDALTCRISGGGDAEIKGTIKNYNLEASGGGDVNSELDADIIDCKVSGGGDLALKDKKKASEAQFIMSGGGDIRLDINVENAKCSVSGGGDATLTGQASNLEIIINGGGDVDAGNFLTTTTLLHVSGGSDIHVNVSKELSGNISGGGNVYYSGNPDNVSVDAKGGSKIIKQ